jgi:hypothetical protein
VLKTCIIAQAKQPEFCAIHDTYACRKGNPKASG